MVEKAFKAMCELENEDEEINYEDVSTFIKLTDRRINI